MIELLPLAYPGVAIAGGSKEDSVLLDRNVFHVEATYMVCHRRSVGDLHSKSDANEEVRTASKMKQFLEHTASLFPCTDMMHHTLISMGQKQSTTFLQVGQWTVSKQATLTATYGTNGWHLFWTGCLIENGNIYGDN